MALEIPNWSPFTVCSLDDRPLPVRSLASSDGIGDRLRVAAFAELQARHAFVWAAESLAEDPDLSRAWSALAQAEDRHLGWLLQRMEDTGTDVGERSVSDALWRALVSSTTIADFAQLMASAEERGRVAGARMEEVLAAVDPVTAELFGRIAEEEVAHIRLARTVLAAC